MTKDTTIELLVNINRKNVVGLMKILRQESEL